MLFEVKKCSTNISTLFGIWPLWRERFNRVVTNGAILLAVDLSMRAEILSGPEDLDMSRDVN